MAAKTIKPTTRTGFTIVELLIVIVVIGILAAITIIAYNGIQNKAILASISSDLENANKQALLFQQEFGAYPTAIDCSASPAAQTICLKTSGNNSYQYAVSNSTTPQTYCVTITNGTNSYYISNTTPMTQGACAGHTIGGVAAITNLIPNPSMETNLTGWGAWAGNGAGATTTRINTPGPAPNGTWFGRLTWTTATTSPSGGPSYSFTVTPGTVYNASVYVRSSKDQNVYLEMKYQSSGGTTLAATNNGGASLTAGVWKRIQFYTSAPANTATLAAGVYGTSTNWAINDYIDFDALMITTGSTTYNYADGNSGSGWAWTGAVNNSTSYGSPL